MKILFDIVNTQFQYSGGAEYIRRVLYSCLEQCEQRNDVTFCCAYDSSIGNFAYDDLTPDSLKNRGIETIDIHSVSLSEVIKHNHIDRVFIGVAQLWGARYDVENIDCEVICVIDDLCDQEFERSQLGTYMQLGNLKYMTRYVINQYLGRDKTNHRMDGIIELIKNNNNVRVVTVSNYSKASIEYNYEIEDTRISVCYSPERIINSTESIENTALKELIEGNCKYYLMTNAHRIAKNAEKMITAFKKYALLDKEAVIVTTGMKESLFDKHISLPFLSESDLANAYKNCYAFLYPTYFEGFGYPPMEAMKYGRPVLSSNTSSMPEILGNAPLYFSPMYETDMYRCLCSLNADEYEKRVHLSSQRYKEISKKQELDLIAVTKLIVE